MGKGPACSRVLAGPEAEHHQALWEELHATVEIWTRWPPQPDRKVIDKVLCAVPQCVTMARQAAPHAAQNINVTTVERAIAWLHRLSSGTAPAIQQNGCCIV